MLSTKQPQAFSPIGLLRSALEDENIVELVEFRSHRDLMFSEPDAKVNQFQWRSHSYRAVAREVFGPLAKLYDHVPLDSFLKCFSVCLPHAKQRLTKFPIRAVAVEKLILGVATTRSLQIRPSAILASLTDLRGVILRIDYSRLRLAVMFGNSLSSSASPILAVRVVPESGWSLEVATGVWDSTGRPDIGRFSNWIIQDWDSALFKITTKVGIGRHL